MASTPVFLPGESHGQGSLAGCSPWGHTESDMTEATWHAHTCTCFTSLGEFQWPVPKTLLGHNCQKKGAELCPQKQEVCTAGGGEKTSEKE